MVATSPLLRLCLLFALVLASAWPSAQAESPVPTRLGAGGDNFGDRIRRWESNIQQVSGDAMFRRWTLDENSVEVQLALELDESVDANEVEQTPDAVDAESNETELAAEDDEPSELDAGQTDTERRREARTMSRIAELKKPTRDILIRALPEGATPENRALQYSSSEPMISISALGIGAPGPDRYTVCFAHRPLYFEQRNLERCGHGCGCWQNKVSAVQFLWNTALWPYHLARQPCCRCVSAGGDCLTCQTCPADCGLLPVDHHGLISQAAAVAGFSFLLL